jgi:hypothetical protein
MHATYRDSARFKYQDCIMAANNNVERAVECVESYIQELNNDNFKISEEFKRDHAKYL